MIQLQIPEQIVLELKPASFGSRALAYMIDWTIRWTFTALLGLVLVLLFFSSNDIFDFFRKNFFTMTEDMGLPWQYFLGGLTLALFIIQWGYSVYFEVMRNGISPGKKMVGLRVVSEQGLPLSFRESLLRTVFGIVDLLPLFGVVALGSMLLTEKKQRLGDVVARTMVVFHEPTKSVAESQNQKPMPAELYTLIEKFLERRYELKPEIRAQSGRELYELAQKYFSESGPKSHEESLAVLLESSYPTRNR